METVLEARGLAKTFRLGSVDVLALRGVDFRLAAGEFVAVTGPSGSGKSTLLHLLGGLDRPTAGEVFLRGRRIDVESERALAMLRRRAFGVVFQSFNLLPALTVAENIQLPAMLAGASRQEGRARAQELLRRLGIAEKADAAPIQLSGGQQQRVAIARAAVNRPEVLLADEPTGNLDSASAREVLSLLRDFPGEGHAVVMVTHDARAAAIADRVITLRDGLVADETVLSEPRPVRGLLDLAVAP